MRESSATTVNHSTTAHKHAENNLTMPQAQQVAKLQQATTQQQHCHP